MNLIILQLSLKDFACRNLLLLLFVVIFLLSSSIAKTFSNIVSTSLFLRKISDCA